MPGNFSIRICITTSEITDACIKAVEAVTTNTNSLSCLLICKMGILSTVRRIRFRHYGLSLIIQRCFNSGCIIARNVVNIKTFCIVRHNMRFYENFYNELRNVYSSVQLHITRLETKITRKASTFDRQTNLHFISLFAKQDSFPFTTTLIIHNMI